jgi:hypothetical protein
MGQAVTDASNGPATACEATRGRCGASSSNVCSIRTGSAGLKWEREALWLPLDALWMALFLRRPRGQCLVTAGNTSRHDSSVMTAICASTAAGSAKPSLSKRAMTCQEVRHSLVVSCPSKEIPDSYECAEHKLLSLIWSSVRVQTSSDCKIFQGVTSKARLISHPTPRIESPHPDTAKGQAWPRLHTTMTPFWHLARSTWGADDHARVLVFLPRTICLSTSERTRMTRK